MSSQHTLSQLNQIEAKRICLIKPSALGDVVQTLPIDTIVSIVQNMQFFVQILPQPGDTLDAAVQIEIDGREVANSSGLIYPLTPWRFVYQFNQALSNIVEVII